MILVVLALAPGWQLQLAKRVRKPATASNEHGIKSTVLTVINVVRIRTS